MSSDLVVFYLIPEAVGPDALESVCFLVRTETVGREEGRARGAAWVSPVPLSGFGPASVSTKMRLPSP